MNNQKKILSFPLTFILLLLISACGTGQPTEIAPEQLNTSDGQVPVQIILYLPDELMDQNIVSEFDERANISVIQRVYDTDADLVSAVESQPGKISFVVATNYAASTLIGQALLSPLTHTNIPNLNKLDIRFRNLTYDPNNQFCAPYAYGTIGIGYVNGQSITPTTWGDIFRLASDSPAYARTTLLDHPREAMGAALIHLGYSANTINEAEIEEAKQLIIQAAGSFDGLDSLDYGQRLATFQTSLAQGFSREFLFMQQVNPEINYALPQEGSLLRIYSLCIPSSAFPEHKQAAEVFINMVLEEEWAVDSVINLQLPTTVSLDANLIALDTRLNPLIYPPDEIWNNSQYIYYLGTSDIVYTIAWDEITNALR
jgi:spermidine/putrescine transport system substrate-binding protein